MRLLHVCTGFPGAWVLQSTLPVLLRTALCKHLKIRSGTVGTSRDVDASPHQAARARAARACTVGLRACPTHLQTLGLSQMPIPQNRGPLQYLSKMLTLLQRLQHEQFLQWSNEFANVPPSALHPQSPCLHEDSKPSKP